MKKRIYENPSIKTDEIKLEQGILQGSVPISGGGGTTPNQPDIGDWGEEENGGSQSGDF